MSDMLPRDSRAPWFAQVFRLADAPGDNLSASTTPAARFEMVAILSARMWELTGKPVPAYSRDTLPFRFVRNA